MVVIAVLAGAMLMGMFLIRRKQTRYTGYT